MATAAALSVRVSANIGDFEKRMRSLERSLDSTGSKFQSMGTKLTVGVTLPIVAAATAATKFASDYERSTTKLVTLSGQSEAQMRMMQKAMLDMGPAVGIGPRALAEAMLVVTSTGFQGAKALEILELSAKASALGMGDSKDVARALTAAIGAYGEENLTAAQAADILHQTVVAGGAEANELAGELGRVVGIASQLGVNFAEVGAFIATYTRLGLSAAEATTGLSGALNTILSPSAEARKALGDVGLSADSLRGLVAERGLGGALSELLGRLNGNADAIGSVFGNVRALAGVMGTAGVQATQYKDNLNAITNSTGGLNTAFERTKQTVSFMWDQMKASAEAAGIKLGMVLLPALQRIAPAVMSVINVIVVLIDWFSRLPQPIQASVLGLIALAAAIGPVLFAIGSLYKAGSTLIGLFRLVGLGGAAAGTGITTTGAAAALATGPVLAFVAAIAGLVFAVPKAIDSLRHLWSTWNQFGTKALLGELGRNVNDDSLSFFKDWRVDQQPNRRKGGGTRAETFIDPNALAGGAAAARLRDEMKNAELAMSSAVGGSRGGGGVAARVNQFSGADILKNADEMMRDLRAIGGLTKLTTDEQENLNRALAAAIDKYGSLGRVAPRAMYDTWLATSLPRINSGVPAGVGESLGTPTMPLPPVPGLPVTSGLPSGIGQSLALPTMPALPPDPGFLSRTFGDGVTWGQSVGRALSDGIRSQGSKVIGFFASLAAQLGQMLADTVGAGLQGSLGKFGGLLGGIMKEIPFGELIFNLATKFGGAIAKLFGRGDDGDKERDAFQDSFGGFKALGAELSQLGAEGERLFQQLQKADSGKDVQAAADQIAKALEAHAQAIDDITSGVNARSANISGQADLDVVGAGATAAFALMIQQGKSAIEAFNALTPSITAMRDALAAGNLTATESVARMLEIGAVLDANKIQFDNIAASGQILSAMLQGNIKDAALFGAVAGDIGTQIQAVIDKGVPMAQVFALAQPQLQAIWEAQQKWGFAVDETTAALLTEAEAQGFVGAQMQSVNQQILNVLIAIGTVLGADIPAALGALPGHAQNAANGMQAAFDGVKGPALPDGWTASDPIAGSPAYGPNVPQMASGGIVRARPGGTLVNVGEGGRDEAIVPLGGAFSSSVGGDVYLDSDLVGRIMLRAVTDEAQRLGVS